MRDSRKNRSFAAVAAVMFCCAASASAQWSGALGSSWNNPTSASISRILIDRMNQRLLAKRLAQKRGAAPAEPTPKTVVVGDRQASSDAARSLSYSSTPNRIKLDDIVADLGGGPEQRAQTRQMLSQILDSYDKESAALGYRNDLPLAFASFIIMSAAAYNATDVPGDEKLIELRSVIAESAVESGIFKSIADRQKQEMSEILVVFGTLAFSGYSQSKQTGDSASMNLFRQLGGQNLKTVLGLDPETVKVDSNGISFASASPGSAPDSTRATPTEVPNMHAGDLVKAYETNEVRADQMFGGKRVRIVGSVNSIESLADGRAALVFRSTVSTYGMAKCFFSKAQRSKLASVSTNQQVMVEGIVKEFGGGWDGAKAYVVLENCTIP